VPSLDAVRAEKGRRRLADFVRAAWPVVEPGRPLIWGWHLDAVCEHLEAVTRGDLCNLIITIPPGCTKSRTVGVFWPAWTWLRWPEARWLFLANAEDLATRESLACRRLVESEWFRGHYPDAVKITGDQNAKEWYENERAGHRQSMSILASVTGKKGDLVCVDDANDAEKVQSEAVRNQINGRWDNAIYDRVIDFKAGRRVVIGQRTHPNDLIGHIKATGPEFVELCVPEEFDPARRVTLPTGWTDPRTAAGEFLRPDQFGPKEKEAAVRRLGTIGYNCKHNQNPTNPEGNRFKKEWFLHRYTHRGDYLVLHRPGEAAGYEVNVWQCRRFGTCDPATSAKTAADFTVLGAWLVTPRHDLVWLDCDRFRAEIPDQLPRLLAFCDKWKLASMGIEAVASNQALLQLASRSRVPARRLNPLGQDKLVRAATALVLAEARRVWLPAPGVRAGFPLDEVEGELLTFSGDEKLDDHDDVPDCLSYAAKLLVEGPGPDDGRQVPMVLGGRW
jgi:hypothetical protein